MPRFQLLVGSLLAIAGCKEVNPEFCKNPDNAHDPHCVLDAQITGGPCTSRDQCTNPELPVCDLSDNGGTCAHCTADDHSLCVDSTPVCSNHACVACTTDDQCDSGVCLPSGGCATADDIIRVAPMGGVATADCGMATNTPCTLAGGFLEVTATRNVMKLAPGMYNFMGPAFAINAPAVTIDARGSTIHRSQDNGEVFVLNTGANVTLLGGTLERATMADGIKCNSGSTLAIYDTVIQQGTDAGINCSGCTLTIARATISQNMQEGIDVTGTSAVTISQSRFITNQGGGLNLGTGATFVVVGNEFFDNGGSASATGGVYIQTTAATANRFDFNAVVQNRAQNGVGAGVNCIAGNGFLAQDNIVWDNGATTNVTEVGGGCMWAWSDIGPTPVGALDGGNNMNIDPKFKDENMHDLHLTSLSPVRHMANPSADLTGVAAMDIDNQPRVPPADLGVDQTQ